MKKYIQPAAKISNFTLEGICQDFNVNNQTGFGSSSTPTKGNGEWESEAENSDDGFGW